MFYVVWIKFYRWGDPKCFTGTVLLRFMCILTSADQNTGGALLEFSITTAMHETSCVSPAIYVWNNNKNYKISPCPLNSGCSSMGKALDYRSRAGVQHVGSASPGDVFPDPFQQLFSFWLYARPSKLQ